MKTDLTKDRAVLNGNGSCMPTTRSRSRGRPSETADLIHNRRRLLGKGQAWLAEKVGLAKATLCAYERGYGHLARAREAAILRVLRDELQSHRTRVEAAIREDYDSDEVDTAVNASFEASLGNTVIESLPMSRHRIG